jgi:hypothetical protein
MRSNDTRDTPADLFTELTNLYGKPFSLDVCACHSNSKVPAAYYTLDGLASHGELVRPGVDGLSGRWTADWFCNPPFSEIGRWVDKAWDSGQPGLMIVPNTKGEQGWWQNKIEPFRDGREAVSEFGEILNPAGGATRLKTHFMLGRRAFLQDGKPILAKNGKRGSPRFGLVALIWRP